MAPLLALLLAAVMAAAPAPACAAGAETAAVETLLHRGDAPAALARAQRALAATPVDPELRFLLGVARMELGLDDEAMASFVALTEEFPQLPDPWNNIALLHARAGRLELARQALERALRNDPGHRTARLNLGTIFLQLAVQSWDQASTAAPLDSATQQRLDAVRALLPRPRPTSDPAAAAGRPGGR